MFENACFRFRSGMKVSVGKAKSGLGGTGTTSLLLLRPDSGP